MNIYKNKSSSKGHTCGHRNTYKLSVMKAHNNLLLLFCDMPTLDKLKEVLLNEILFPETNAYKMSKLVLLHVMVYFTC